MRISKIVGLLAFVLAGCSSEAPETPEAPKTKVDLLLHNAQILTMNDAQPTASAVAITRDRIVAVGGAELMDKYEAANARDLAGRTVIPGFIDSHTHISGQPNHYIDLTNVGSVAEIKKLVAQKVVELGEDQWITGYGWSEDELAEGRRPMRSDLDAAAPNNPVVLTRAGAHSAVNSSMALARAGIDATTPDPDGGIIERDERGELNGIIRERHEMVLDLVPPATDESVRPSFVRSLQALFEKGITSIVQAQDTIEHYAEWQRIYAEHRGELPRAAVQVAYEGAEAMAAFGMKSGDGDEHLRVGPIKIFVDGGFTGPAAYTSRPYKGEDEYRGKLNMTEGELRDLIFNAHRDGWQLGIHAIGDAAIDLSVGYLVEALAEYPREGHRHYLNHFTLMPTAETMRAMATHGIAITQQPNFTYTLEGRYVANLDGSRLETNNPLRTPMDHGIHVAISSDILPIGPMVGIYAAVTRKGMSGRVFGAHERLTPLEALQGYTDKGAYLTFEEGRKGQLVTGQLADLVVLAENPLEVAPDDLKQVAVLETYLGGRQVYKR